MSGSGGNPLNNAIDGLKDKISKWQNDPLGEGTADAIDMASGGLVRYNPTTGKGSEGFTLHHTDEWIGELSGRNKLRAAGYIEQKNIDDAAAAQKQNFLNQQLQAYRTDVAASQSAQGVRNTAAARSAVTQLASTSLGADSSDLLGA